MRTVTPLMAALFATACSIGGTSVSTEPERSVPVRVKALPVTNGVWFDPKNAPEFHQLIATRSCDLVAELGTWHAPNPPDTSKTVQHYLTHSLAVESIHSQSWKISDLENSNGIARSGEVWCLAVPNFYARYELLAKVHELVGEEGQGADATFRINPGFRDVSSHPNVSKLVELSFNSVGIPHDSDYQSLIDSGECHLSISFGSIGAGTARAHSGAMINRLLTRDDVTKVYRKGWGRHGEHDYCAVIPDEAARAEVFEDVQLIADTLGQSSSHPVHFALLPDPSD